MNLKSAQSLIRCHRPGRPETQDAAIQKAVRIAEGMPDLKAALASQIEFDNRQADIIRGIVPDENFLNKIDDTFERLQKSFQWSALRQPPFLAGASAILVLLFVLVYFGPDWLDGFPGREAAEQMIEMTEEMTGIELEPKVTEAGNLEDWFFSNGYQNFRILPEFAHMKTVGCRVFWQHGCPVAQIAIENHSLLLYIFHAEDFDVKLEPPERWRLFQQGEWTVAIRGENTGTCFMAAFRGKKAGMKDFLASLEK